jgi:hypothetical protein
VPGQKLENFTGWFGLAEKISLSLDATLSLQIFELFVRFDPFARRRYSETAAQPRYRTNNRLGIGVGSEIMDE